VFRGVSNDAVRCRFSTSCPLVQFGLYRLVLGGVSPLGHFSGTQMPGSVGPPRRRERVVAMTTMTATANCVQSARVEGMGMDETVDEEQVPRLGRGQIAAVMLSVGLGVVVAGYGLVGSYVAVSELADRHDVPLAGWVPAGLDGGLVAVVVLDLVLTWIGTPVGWLRQLVRVLSTGTVVANAVAGWPDPVAIGLHVAAPLILLAMIEAGRTVLLRRIGETHGTRREPIPLIRWVLAPWRTLLLWRRMALWQITSYRTAIDTELQLRRAMTLLRVHYGHRWRRRAPTDLVWMLRTGVDVGEACERVQALVDIDGCVVPAEMISLGAATQSELGVSESRPTCMSASDSSSVRAEALPLHVDDVHDRLDEALQLNRRYWMETGRPISAETLRQRLHISANASRDLTRAVRATDRAAILAVGA
jgi:hypothetical protein